VIDEFGIIPVSTSDTIDIPLVVLSVSPFEDLNPFGGTDLTIYAQNLPPKFSSKT